MEQTSFGYIMNDITIHSLTNIRTWKTGKNRWITKTDPCYGICFYHFYGGR